MPDTLTMKSQDEILARIEQVKPTDYLGFAQEVLIGALDFEHAKAFLKPDVKAKDWPDESDLDDQRKQALEYLKFAWGKAEDHRGISASRSVSKLTQWAWLFGLDDVAYRMERGPYAQYGAPALKLFAEAMGEPVPDDPELRNMMEGLPCHPGCDEGCGH